MGGYFHHGRGQAALADLLLIHLPKAGLGAEGLGTPLAAEEDNPLVKDAQTADLHRPGGAHKGVGGAYIHGVEAAVEAHRLHIDVYMQQLRTAGLDAHGTVNGTLGTLRGVKTEVLDAVFVGRYSTL